MNDDAAEKRTLRGRLPERFLDKLVGMETVLCAATVYFQLVDWKLFLLQRWCWLGQTLHCTR